MKEHIEAIQKYMREKYGVNEVEVSVGIHDTSNPELNRELADLITKEVAEEFNTTAYHWQYEGCSGAKLRSWDKKFTLSTFYPIEQYQGE